MHLLLITGSMGAGKTTTLAEASDLLTQRAISHAAIDLDALGVWHHDVSDDLETANLRCICGNYAQAGIDRLVIAAAVETRTDLDRIVEASGADAVVVVRLRAPVETMESRVGTRERGIHGARYASRVAALERILDEAGLEHFAVDATRHVTEVAQDVLRSARWIE